MTDKKLTDKEIIKALECCTSEDLATLNCGHCPNQQTNCMHILYKSTLDLINRQQTEIERLKAKCENTQIGYNFAQDDIRTLKKDKYKLQKALNQSEYYRVIAKTEAYIEFAERLKEKTKWLFSSVSINNEIDNLLKEFEEKINEKKEG